MFEEMGFCYSEVRSFLSNNLKQAVERSRHKQIDSNNYLHFEHLFYQGGIHMQILLDVAEKHSIYDRSKLLWQLCSDLEASKEFINDTKYITEKQLIGARSKLNPKSRSFNSRSSYAMESNDNSRLAERLLVEVGSSTARQQASIAQLTTK